MAYKIYVDNELVGMTKDSMSAVARCNDFMKLKLYEAKDIRSMYVHDDGTEEPHDWLKDYNELCYGRY